jgi:hypothetical protein
MEFPRVNINIFYVVPVIASFQPERSDRGHTSLTTEKQTVKLASQVVCSSRWHCIWKATRWQNGSGSRKGP